MVGLENTYSNVFLWPAGQELSEASKYKVMASGVTQNTHVPPACLDIATWQWGPRQVDFPFF